MAKGFEDYNKAVSNGYDDAQLYYSMGLLHEEIGEMDLAIRSYSKAALHDSSASGFPRRSRLWTR